MGAELVLYLDIDGVLLRRRHTGMFDAFEIAPGCLDFLEWTIARFAAVGCRLVAGRVGRMEHAVPSTMPARGWTIPGGECWTSSSRRPGPSIKPKRSTRVSDFWWLDDDRTVHDRNWLLAHNREDRLIRASCDVDPDALAVALATLGRAMLGQSQVPQTVM